MSDNAVAIEAVSRMVMSESDKEKVSTISLETKPSFPAQYAEVLQHLLDVLECCNADDKRLVCKIIADYARYARSGPVGEVEETVASSEDAGGGVAEAHHGCGPPNQRHGTGR